MRHQLRRMRGHVDSHRRSLVLLPDQNQQIAFGRSSANGRSHAIIVWVERQAGRFKQLPIVGDHVGDGGLGFIGGVQ